MEIFQNVKYVYDCVKYTFGVSRNDLVDPLSIIIKLIILSHKPIGTKVSIQNNKIIIQNNSLIQGTIRSIYGDKKTDINILCAPVIFACIHYLLPPNRERFLHIFKNATSGLAKLKDTYIGKDIVYNIEQIKNIVDSFIMNEKIDPGNFIANYQSQVYKLKIDTYKHISTVWDDKRYDILFNILEELDKSNEHNKESILCSLTHFLDFIDINVSETIKDL